MKDDFNESGGRNERGGDRLPPHSIEAEQGVLGCALNDPANVLVTMVEKRVNHAWFYDLRHQIVFNEMLRLYSGKQERPIDLILLQQALKDAGQLEEIGGVTYLLELQEKVPSAANLPYYLDICREKWRLRNLLAWSTAISATVYEHSGEVDQLYARIETEFEAMAAPSAVVKERHIKEVILENVMPLIERHYSRGHTQLDGLPTGDNWYLDKVLLGLAREDYVILAGRPGSGKTSLALNIVDYLATRHVHWKTLTEAEHKRMVADGNDVSGYEFKEAVEKEPAHWLKRCVGVPVAIFTLEMSDESLGFRLVFGHARVSSGSFRQGYASEEAFVKIRNSVTELCKSNIYLDAEADQTIDMIAAKAARMKKQYGIELFVLDYLQLLDGDNGDNDRVRALRKISKKIVSLKKRLKTPWLVLAQMNRAIETVERARRPVMSDLKESGSLEQDADKIVILYPPLKTEGIEDDEEIIAEHMMAEKVSSQDWPRRVNALVVKNRNGPTGVASLLFQNNQCLFQDWRRWCVDRGVVERAKGEAKSTYGQVTDEDIPQ